MEPIEAILGFDTREQRPYRFEACRRSKFVDFTIKREALSAGDYSSRLRNGDGPADTAVVERKSLSDLFGTLTRGRDRFMRECQRLVEFGHACIVIESDIDLIVGYACRPSCGVSAQSILASLTAISQRFSLPIWFAGSRHHAELLTFRILERWVRDLAPQPTEEVVSCLS